VVAYDVGGISEVVKTGLTGQLVSRNDEVAFVSAVATLLQISSEEKKNITDKAYELAISQYDNKVITEQFLKAYDQVLAASN
jgi:glycosyltransferase involved in cell wall biosynthesis